jgi:hypothetical protein
MKTLKQLININKITINSEYADNNPHMENSNNMDNYKVTLYCKRKQMSLYFSMGYGHNGNEPTVLDVLECLQMDSNSFVNDTGFSDFCDELGYDEDSRKAYKIYLDVLKSGKKLKKFLGVELFDDLMVCDYE